MLSLLFVSKGIKNLLLTKKNQTLAVLTGLVIGALVVPLKEITFGSLELVLIAGGIVFSLVLAYFSKN